MKKSIVISAVNITIGGTLTILKDCLNYLSKSELVDTYIIYAIVHSTKDLKFDNIVFIKMPWVKKRWFNRIWCEYFVFKKMSIKMNVYLWFSLHDITPRVIAQRQAVYCHNAFPFYKTSIYDLFFNYKVFLFSCLTHYIYKINQKSNDKILVQQFWMYSKFKEIYNISDKTLMLSPPISSSYLGDNLDLEMEYSNIYTFLFPSTPGSYKNFHCLCSAAELLENEVGKEHFKVLITIKGDENKYAKWLLKKFSKINSLKFVGYLSQQELYNSYSLVNCLVFPSKVESWGLPISEFASYNKPMLLADVPYAYEASQNASMVGFFNPNKPGELSIQMRKLLFGDYTFLTKGNAIDYDIPLYTNWELIFSELLK
jgi:glycosyltransferase involved in cell wall biosynthesis